jgi:calcium-translocating P-type ATPase
MLGYQQKTEFSRNGLSTDEARESARLHGRNVLTKQKGKGFGRRFLGNLNDPVIRILLGALAVNLLLLIRGADWIETVGIAVAVFLAAFISTLSEHSSERAFERLSEEGERVMCRVRRDGQVASVPLSEVVVGDCVLLSAGDRIPADGVLIDGALSVDQSAMTGESREVEKRPAAHAERDPSSPSYLFRGCTVMSGSGEMGVREVGDASFLGEISREVQTETRPSPLKLRLKKLAGQISVLGYVAAVMVALAYLFHVFFLDSGMRWEVIRFKVSDVGYLFSKLLHAFTLGLTVIVVAVPEGLPMMIAVVLSSNVRRMVRDQVLVRKAVGIEAAGSMNLLFTDKTGTLTEGKMRLTSMYFADGVALSSPTEPNGRKTREAEELLSLAFRGGDATVGSGDEILGGNATERALLSSVRAIPPSGDYRILSRCPFDSARKYSAVTYVGKRRVTFVLGASEKLLPYVSGAVGADGRPTRFSKHETERWIGEHTKKGERCLIVAISGDGMMAESLQEGLRTNLTLLAAVSLCDPVRAEAKVAVRDLQGAGIGVVMITGDSRETARAIAVQCGILDGERKTVITGDELARMSDTHVCELLPRLAAVARALPTDKSRLVRLAQGMGLVTGMTGDGVNDAPALRLADIGFAMGSGTQVAKDAGDIVILDDNLASVVRAVLYGRTVFKSIRKFITLQLTMNFSAVGVTMICPFLGIDSPVTVVQMLWINLIMDTLGGLAFAGEAPLSEYMHEPPKRQSEGILNRYMANEILLLGGFTVGLCLLFLKHPFFTSHFRIASDKIYLLTAFFALFIFSSVFNCFNARTDRFKTWAGLGKNRIFLLIMAVVLAVQILFVYLGGTVLRTVPLTARELLFTMLVSLSVFPFELLRKLLWRLRGRRRGY